MKEWKSVEAANFFACASQNASCEADVGTVISSKYPFLVNALTFPYPYFMVVYMTGGLLICDIFILQINLKLGITKDASQMPQ